MEVKILNSVKTSLLIKVGLLSIKDLNVEACIKKGMKLGKNCHGLNSSIIDYAHCWLIEIGDNVTFAPQVYLLANGASTKRYLNYTKIAKIKIEDNVFVGVRAIIMPGVSIAKYAIVAAGSVVTKSIPEGAIVGGNPAKILNYTDQYIEKHKVNMLESHVYEREWTLGGNITEEMIKKMSAELDGQIGYVK